MARVRFENIGFTYPHASAPALQGISLEVESGEYLCVCGKSASGKSTLLRQLKPALHMHGAREGKILLDGIPLHELSESEQASRIGYVMQDPDAQIVTDMVWRELAFGLECLGVEQEIMRQRVAETASFFGMQSWFEAPVDSLSGGQKQALNLASALVLHPDVLVLDEPTSQLDPIAATRFLSMIRRINQELGLTVIMSEHRLEEAYLAADSIAVLEEGRLLAHGTRREVAAALYREGSDVSLALPTPIRVFYGVMSNPWGDSPCPLSIREGRSWLDAWTCEHALTMRSLPDKEPSEERVSVMRLQNVWFRFERDGNDILRDVELEVPESSILAIVGPNGAGKTTLLKCICGVERPYRGSIEILGKKLSKWKRDDLFHGGVALMPQDPKLLFTRQTVREELLEMLEERQGDDAEKADLVQEALERCRVAHLAHKSPFDLSGGEQQCVALAKILLARPRILLLDEPTKGMDSMLKREFRSILRDLQHEDVTVIVVSHDVEFCARTADDVAMMFDGSVTAFTDARRFFSSNAFYTTAASRMSRGMLEGAITDEDIVALCLS